MLAGYRTAQPVPVSLALTCPSHVPSGLCSFWGSQPGQRKGLVMVESFLGVFPTLEGQLIHLVHEVEGTLTGSVCGEEDQAGSVGSGTLSHPLLSSQCLDPFLIFSRCSRKSCGGREGWWSRSEQHLLVLPLYCQVSAWSLRLPPGCCTPWLCLRRVPEPWHLERKGCSPQLQDPHLTVPGWVSQDMSQEEKPYSFSPF